MAICEVAYLTGVFVLIKAAIKTKATEVRNRIWATSTAALVVPPRPRTGTGKATRREEMIREDMGVILLMNVDPLFAAGAWMRM